MQFNLKLYIFLSQEWTNIAFLIYEPVGNNSGLIGLRYSYLKLNCGDSLFKNI